MERAIGLEQLTMHAGLGVHPSSDGYQISAPGVFDLPHAM